jgi:hypothetical protein
MMAPSIYALEPFLFRPRVDGRRLQGPLDHYY